MKITDATHISPGLYELAMPVKIFGINEFWPAKEKFIIKKHKQFHLEYYSANRLNGSGIAQVNSYDTERWNIFVVMLKEVKNMNNADDIFGKLSHETCVGLLRNLKQSGKVSGDDFQRAYMEFLETD